jgi:hypothetical protein
MSDNHGISVKIVNFFTAVCYVNLLLSVENVKVLNNGLILNAKETSNLKQ